MTNLLNTYLSNQFVNRPLNQSSEPFPANNSRVKPMKAKGKLLPSRVIGSPVEYAKDLKKDVVSIGKAAKGKANDHELGRINDLAMKAGSLALAAYLFVKNPLKLSKAMEFVGFGTFFGAMALWPKLAIQAPVKARTGVDIHQKYVDSQGRKKMLHQDPQYDLTDLYSREDLDKMGKKLGVSEDLPDRDNFIKRRAKKTAVQGNTLWMMTAGIATPLISALASNRLEKPVGKIIETVDLASSENAVAKGKGSGFFSRIKQSFSAKSFDKYLTKNADKVMDDKIISEIASKMGVQTNSAVMQTAIAQELASMKNTVKFDEAFVRTALQGKVPDSIFKSLNEQQKALLDKAINEKSTKGIADILSKASGTTKRQQVKLAGELTKTLDLAKNTAEKPTVSQVSQKIKSLYSNVADFTSGKKVLDRYINVRVGDQAGTYIANQWSRVCDELLKSLKLNGKELKAVSQGDMSIVADKLSAIASDDVRFDKTVKQLMKLINGYEQTAGSDFAASAQSYTERVCTEAARGFKNSGFTRVADRVSSSAKKGTVENVINVNTRERITGAQSSFYRLLQSLDLNKQIKNGKFKEQLTAAMSQNGLKTDEAAVTKLTKACKDIVMNATTTDYVEKLKSSGFNLSQAEYKTVMDVLLSGSSGSAIEQSLAKTAGNSTAKTMMSGYTSYIKEFKNKVANWQNGITPELSRCTVDGVTNGANAVERNNLAGKPVKDLIQDAAKKTYNSKMWMKIFGGAMIALTAITLTAGLLIGRKGKTEKEVEAENKIHG